MKTLIPLLLFVLITATAPAFAQSEKVPDTRPGPVNYTDEEYDLLFEHPGNIGTFCEIENDTIDVITQFANDVGVEAILSPQTGTNLTDNVVTIRVKNFGADTQSNIPVYYTLDGGTPVTGVVPGPIAPGQTEDFTFPGTVIFNNPGHTYQFIGCTALEGDDNPGNDCKTMNLLYMPNEWDFCNSPKKTFCFFSLCSFM